MKRRPVLGVTALLLLAFGLGVGSRVSGRRIVSGEEPLPVPSVRAPNAPAASRPPPWIDIRNAGLVLAGTGGDIAVAHEMKRL